MNSVIPSITAWAHAWFQEHDCIVGEFEGEPFVVSPAYGSDGLTAHGLVESREFQTFVKVLCGDRYPYDAWGFSDEYSTCTECYQIVGTTPQFYGWTPKFYIGDCGLICKSCVDTDPDDYIEYLIQSAADGKAVSCNLIDPLDHEFSLILEDLHHGLHEHMNDDPRIIAKCASEGGLQAIFHVRPSQFYIDFDVYMRKDESDNSEADFSPKLSDSEIQTVKDCLLTAGKYTSSLTLRDEFRQWPSPADNCKAALRSNTSQFASIDSDTGHVTAYASLDEMAESMQADRAKRHESCVGKQVLVNR